jgi:hypothetical protein
MAEEQTIPAGNARRPTRERTIQPGPRFAVLLIWTLIDAGLIAAAVWWGLGRYEAGQRNLAYALFGSAAILAILDLWRLVFLNRVRKLVAKGRIEHAEIVAVRKTRFSMRPRADAAAPTVGWPILPACRVAYAFARNGKRTIRGAFVVAAKEAQMFVRGEDIEIFVDRRDSSKLIPSLVARWYFRVSSRMIGPKADDPEWDFTMPPPVVGEKDHGPKPA